MSPKKDGTLTKRERMAGAKRALRLALADVERVLDEFDSRLYELSEQYGDLQSELEDVDELYGAIDVDGQDLARDLDDLRDEVLMLEGRLSRAKVRVN